MSDPKLFDPLTDLICKRKSVLQKTGLIIAALHTRACACACAAHISMSQSPNIKFNKKIEILMWDNSERVRSGTSFALVMEMTHG